MMNFNLEMPGVGECDMTRCAYNHQQNCHARAITVGSGIHAMCDTFFGSTRHCLNTAISAGVGACKVSACDYNDDYECQADSIHIGVISGKAQCLTCSL